MKLLVVEAAMQMGMQVLILLRARATVFQAFAGPAPRLFIFGLAVTEVLDTENDNEPPLNDDRDYRIARAR